MRKLGKMLIALCGAIVLVCTALPAACGGAEPVYYTVTASYRAEYGSVSLDPEREDDKYEAGEGITVAVTANEGYEVYVFIVNAEEVPLTDGSYTFTVISDTTITALFREVTEVPPVEKQHFTVTAGSYSQGSVELNPASADETYEEGTELTVTVTANEGYEIVALTLNGEEVSLNPTKVNIDEAAGTVLLQGKYTFTVSEKTVIEAIFRSIVL